MMNPGIDNHLIRYALAGLREMHPAACDTDIRIVWLKDNQQCVAVWNPRDNELIPLPDFCGVREMRLLALQLLELARETEQIAKEPHGARP